MSWGGVQLVCVWGRLFSACVTPLRLCTHWSLLSAGWGWVSDLCCGQAGLVCVILVVSFAVAIIMGLVLRRFLVDEGASCCSGWRASGMSYLPTLSFCVSWIPALCSLVLLQRIQFQSPAHLYLVPQDKVVVNTGGHCDPRGVSCTVLDWAGAGSGQPQQDERVVFLLLCRARFLKGLLLMVPSVPPSSCHVAPAYA